MCESALSKTVVRLVLIIRYKIIVESPHENKICYEKTNVQKLHNKLDIHKKVSIYYVNQFQSAVIE